MDGFMLKIETRSEHAIGFANFIKNTAYYNAIGGWYRVDNKIGYVHRTTEQVYEEYIVFLNNKIET